MTALQNAGVNSPHYRKLTKYLFDLKLDMAKFHVAKEQLNKVKSNTKIKKIGAKKLKENNIMVPFYRQSSTASY